MQLDKRRRGDLGESIAALFLQLHGYQILGRNVRCADVEIDLLARRARQLLVVEVKLRTSGVLSAVQALRPQQRQRLARAARALLAQHRWATEIQLDVVGVEWHPQSRSLRIEHLPGVHV